MEIKFLRFFIIIIVSQFIVGCNFEKSPHIIKQELLYDHSKKEDKFDVSLKTTFKYDKKTGDDEFFLAIGKDKIKLIPKARNQNEVEYISYFKTKESIYADSTFVNKIKFSPILNSENKEIKKNDDYKFDIRSTLWIGDDKQNPYIKLKYD
ncbi:hypothetical protein LF887_05305 [Chryseobacterium sp. MEBOG06]|uniref:hypothetical protein n=1 Tax=Chryseobacterium sp. MEBOG06 TaxID=2879938 RepID=UPI001F1E2BF0|nr:hypothetical protein [Chryseobacterium sp. MEBOG06]UKB85044.1 hypothetical protein LF887_05305 [Chryseobacterium sp. MEBOG06]